MLLPVPFQNIYVVILFFKCVYIDIFFDSWNPDIFFSRLISNASSLLYLLSFIIFSLGFFLLVPPYSTEILI